MDSHKDSRDEAILTSVAESIGSTLGTIAAKAGAVQKAFKDRVSEVEPRMRRATKRAAASVKKRVRPATRKGRKGSAALAKGKNRAAATVRRAKRKL